MDSCLSPEPWHAPSEGATCKPQWPPATRSPQNRTDGSAPLLTDGQRHYAALFGFILNKVTLVAGGWQARISVSFLANCRTEFLEDVLAARGDLELVATPRRPSSGVFTISGRNSRFCSGNTTNFCVRPESPRPECNRGNPCTRQLFQKKLITGPFLVRRLPERSAFLVFYRYIRISYTKLIY